jgi:hypothetical protein
MPPMPWAAASILLNRSMLICWCSAEVGDGKGGWMCAEKTWSGCLDKMQLYYNDSCQSAAMMKLRAGRDCLARRGQSFSER